MKENKKNVLIVGASSSLGPLIIEKFLAENYSVIATYNSKPSNNKSDDRITSLEVDLLSEDSLTKNFEIEINSFSEINLVIFLSGILPGLSLEDYNYKLMKKVMGVNFIGQAEVLRCLRPKLADGSSILFLSSISGSRGSFDPIYAASKSAQNAFIKSLVEWLSPNIRINSLAPGLIEGTSMFNEMSEERREYHRSLSPTKKLTTKKDIADIIYNLNEPLWKNLNGQVIHLNGGSYV